MCTGVARKTPLKNGRMEEWKEYYEYLVSNTGKVVNKHGREVKGYIQKTSGYKYRKVTLRINGKRTSMSVAHLVSICFLGGGNAQHADGNVDNNSCENLKTRYRGELSQEKIDRYIRSAIPCVKHRVKVCKWNEIKGLDVDNIIGNALLSIWKNLSSYGINNSFYYFCKKYTHWAFLKEYAIYCRRTIWEVNYDF